MLLVNSYLKKKKKSLSKNKRKKDFSLLVIFPEGLFSLSNLNFSFSPLCRAPCRRRVRASVWDENPGAPSSSSVALSEPSWERCAFTEPGEGGPLLRLSLHRASLIITSPSPASASASHRPGHTTIKYKKKTLRFLSLWMGSCSGLL